MSQTEVLRFRDEREPGEGVGVVEFRLIYRGPLKVSSDGRDKHEIRRKLHPQLRELWQVQEPLRRWSTEYPPGMNMPDRLADLHRVGLHRFVPLVTRRLALVCELDILFLRREAPGGIIQGGDIDNRLKPLFDALKIPSDTGGLPDTPPEAEDPLYVLLQDDYLVSKVSVTTDRLLEPLKEDEHRNDVHLIIGTQLKVLSRRFGTGGLDENYAF